MKPHVTFWGVAGVGLVWNLIGCLNYVAQTSPEAVAQMSEVAQVMITGRPAWATGAFAVTVFGGAVGCILLLLRRRTAVWMLGAGVLGSLGTAYFTAGVLGMVPSVALATLISMALFWYGTIALRKGWLH
ncbi:hypothetical protein [Thalassobacter stenotrophicus]|uniref:hypothetical protein n=1 Tax=Thalassobacter stenotrophicus TaxID=266809 RepID=UPI00056E40DF|nr:hypothetical protein [Thalassobacter stenotrophicus]